MKKISVTTLFVLSVCALQASELPRPVVTEADIIAVTQVLSTTIPNLDALIRAHACYCNAFGGHKELAKLVATKQSFVTPHTIFQWASLNALAQPAESRAIRAFFLFYGIWTKEHEIAYWNGVAGYKLLQQNFTSKTD